MMLVIVISDANVTVTPAPYYCIKQGFEHTFKFVLIQNF